MLINYILNHLHGIWLYLLVYVLDWGTWRLDHNKCCRGKGCRFGNYSCRCWFWGSRWIGLGCWLGSVCWIACRLYVGCILNRGVRIGSWLSLRCDLNRRVVPWTLCPRYLWVCRVDLVRARALFRWAWGIWWGGFCGWWLSRIWDRMANWRLCRSSDLSFVLGTWVPVGQEVGAVMFFYSEWINVDSS